MTALLRRLFLPGERVPASRAYEEVDADTWTPVRRLALRQGEQFPPPEQPGTFFTVPVQGEQNATRPTPLAS
jgi:hypothetical protein